MKILMIIVLLALVNTGQAQTYIEPQCLEVTVNKTTNLIFPATIVSIDRGSEHIVVQKSTTNILRIKAESNFGDTTNLTVITTDGKLYSFLVSYSASPKYFTLNLGNKNSVKPDSLLAAYCFRILKDKSRLYGLQFENGFVFMQLLRFYVIEDIIYCKLKIENRSALTFPVEQFNFSIRDANATKRTAVQETQLNPIYITPDEVVVKPRSAQMIVIAFSKFSISDKKLLNIAITEKGNGRQLAIDVSAHHILQAKNIQ